MSTDNRVCLEWLAGALRRLRPEGQTKVVSYLDAVSEEVLFEMKGGPSIVNYVVTYPVEDV